MAFTDTQIADSVNRVIKFYEKNKRLPTYITVGNNKLTRQQYIALTQMQNSLKNAKAFCTKNNRMPNTVSICGVNMSKDLFTALFNYKCTSTNTKTTTATKTTTMTTNKNTKWLNPPQCGQDYPYDCACASLQQMFYHLTGKVVAESTLMKWAGTTSVGTPHSGIDTAVAKFNKVYKTSLKNKWYNFSDFGSWTKVKAQIDDPNKGVFFHIKYANGGLCKNACKFGHYESVRGCDLKNKTITVNNSLGTKKGNGYKGFIQERPISCQEKMMSYISQPSICVVSK